jgi:DNA-binding PadR family transcriptional regulator
MPAALTPTSYGILGLLAIKPWTTYELTRQMDRAVGQFWPRAESRLYEEPKKLVAHGLAAAEREHVGQRPRTVYSITSEGRERLATWVAQPAQSPPELHVEAMIKVFFAEHGSRDDLSATIESIHAWTDERLAVSAGIAAEYLEGRGAFPERLPWLLLTGRLLDEHVLAVRRWAEWAAALVKTWPEDVSRAEPPLDAVRDMAQHLERELGRG